MPIFRVKPLPPLLAPPLLAEPRPTSIVCDQRGATLVRGVTGYGTYPTLSLALDATALHHALDLEPVPTAEELAHVPSLRSR